MIYLKSVEICNNTYVSNKLPLGFKFECSDINVFVGEQGSGKTTLLKMLSTAHSDINVELTEWTIQHGVDTFYFNTETDNPRIKDPLLFTNVSGEDKGIGYAGAVMSRFQSHGEIMKGFTINPLLKAKNCVIFIDEPEAGLSITNQFKLISAIEQTVENGCQIFIATHCYPIIERFNVISLEHLKEMAGIDFINKIKIRKNEF